jgi:16S rRNA (cytosine1402-N4)-methyltransferase
MPIKMNISDFDFEDIAYIFDNYLNNDDFVSMDQQDHISVLAQESIDALNIKDSGIYVDCTFGAGGHSRRILEANPNCNLIAFDRDPTTKKFADILSKEFGDRFFYINSRFSNLKEELINIGINKVDGFLFDLGFSSMQIDTPRRGFSFQNEGPLDMRMGDDGITAEELINETKEDELAGIIFKFGDERKSRSIAKAISASRKHKRIETTTELAEIIKKAVGRYNDNIHPATRTFQAIRIYLNQELEEIKTALNDSLNMLNENGRLAVISFHSGEDVIIKNFFKQKSGQNISFSRYAPIPSSLENIKELEMVNRKPITPNEQELANNVRARSAKLRIARKLKINIH